MSNVTYVRWKRGEDRIGRAWESIRETHPAFLCPCPVCLTSMGAVEGGFTVVAIGPDDDTNRKAHDGGEWYSAMAVLVHTRCLVATSPIDLEMLVYRLLPVGHG